MKQRRNQILPAALLALCLLLVPALNRADKYKLTLFLAGDSTMADKALNDNPETGWGQVLPLFFKPDIRVVNLARNGRSTKSFIEQGLWTHLMSLVKPGDYVVIQFGHNDEKSSDSSRYAPAYTAYRKNLIRFVSDVRDKGAHPILATPVSRRKYDKSGKFVDQHGDYPGVVREVAAEFDVPLVDMHRKSMNLLTEMGPDRSESLFLRAAPAVYRAFPNGKSDNTHFNRQGALAMARLFSDGLAELNHPLAASLQSPGEMTAIGAGKVVGLDTRVNHETHTSPISGKKEAYHYTWEDRENSGFWIFGNIFENASAFLDGVDADPDSELLSHLSVYIIVDPDTPAESDHPQSISEEGINALETWVRGGGVLLLMANDSGNCEFTRFNALADRFGIHFNEDRFHSVRKGHPEDGTFDKLPDIPLFQGVRSIYMKEICSLSLSENATSLLSENGHCFMAESKFGKGLVLAVGDPWIYNEYIDHRRLPDSVDNIKAAENLVRHLLKSAKAIR